MDAGSVPEGGHQVTPAGSIDPGSHRQGARRYEPPLTPRTYRREPAMSTIHRSRTIISSFAAVFMVALSAPIAVHAEDPVVPVEEQALAPASIPGPTVSVADSRVSAAQQALLSPDLGSMQEEALRAVVATTLSWDQTSGYRAVEAIRATIGHPVASTT